MTDFVEISREEWTKRYAKRIMDVAGWAQEEADAAAIVGAECYEQNERAAGNKVLWIGYPAGMLLTPEENADEEMSYWENDE
jgi:hypothetical protein